MDGPSCLLFFRGVRSYNNRTRRTKSDHPVGSPSHEHLKRGLSLSFSMKSLKSSEVTAQPPKGEVGGPLSESRQTRPSGLPEDQISRSSGSSSATNVGWKGCTPANANLASQACCTKTEKAGSKAHVFWSATQIRTLSKTSGIQEPRALRKATYGCTESTT